MTEANSHNLFVGLCPSSKFYRHMSFLKPALFLSSGKKPLTWCAPYTELFSVTGSHRHSKLDKICTWEHNWSKGSKRKIATEKLNINYKTQK